MQPKSHPKQTKSLDSVLAKLNPSSDSRNQSLDESLEVIENEASTSRDKRQEINLVSPNPVSMMNGHHRNDDVVVVPLEDEPTPIKVNGTVLNGVEQSDELDEVPENVNCTACNKRLNVRRRKICSHPRLGTILCKVCLKFINSSTFSRDAMGIEEYCTWCGDGGNLVCCDFCEKAYCKHCVKRNVGKEFLQALLTTEDVKWKCFSCDKAQISSLIDTCNIVLDFVRKQKLNDAVTINAGPTQIERLRRLSEVQKIVEKEPLQHVKYKSSFQRYEGDDIEVVDEKEGYIDDSNFSVEHDENNSGVQDSNANKNNERYISTAREQVKSHTENVYHSTPVSHNDSKRKLSKSLNKVKLGRTGSKKEDSASEENEQPAEDVFVTTRSGRSTKHVSYNENSLFKSAAKEAVKTAEKELNKKTRKKKRIVTLELSSSESDTDEEIIVISKKGKKQMISKSMLLAAQALLDQKEPKVDLRKKEKRNKKNKGKKGLSSFMKLNFGVKSSQKSSSNSESAQSEVEDGENDKKEVEKGNTETDNIVEMKCKAFETNGRSEKNKTEKVHLAKDIALKEQSAPNRIMDSSVYEDRDDERIVEDGERPGPSGLRPKRLLPKQRSTKRSQKPRTSSSSEDEECLNSSRLLTYHPMRNTIDDSFRSSQSSQISENENINTNLSKEKNDKKYEIDDVSVNCVQPSRDLTNKTIIGSGVNVNHTANTVNADETDGSDTSIGISLAEFVAEEKAKNIEAKKTDKEKNEGDATTNNTEENSTETEENLASSNINATDEAISVKEKGIYEEAAAGESQKLNDETDEIDETAHIVDDEYSDKADKSRLNKANSDCTKSLANAQVIIDDIKGLQSSQPVVVINPSDVSKFLENPGSGTQIKDVAESERTSGGIRDVKNTQADSSCESELQGTIEKRRSTNIYVEDGVNLETTISYENDSENLKKGVKIKKCNFEEKPTKCSSSDNLSADDDLGRSNSEIEDDMLEERPQQNSDSDGCESKKYNIRRKTVRLKDAKTKHIESGSDSEFEINKDRQLKKSNTAKRKDTLGKEEFTETIKKDTGSNNSHAKKSRSKSKNETNIANDFSDSSVENNKDLNEDDLNESDSELEEIPLKRSLRKRKKDIENGDKERSLKKTKKRRKICVSSSGESEDEVTLGLSKGKKRKKITYQSSGSSSSSSDSDPPIGLKSNSESSDSDKSICIIRKGKGKQKGIKKNEKKKKETVDISDDDENVSPSKKGRKKIRRILKDIELNEETRHARELEEQRRKRLLERTKAEREGIEQVLEVDEGEFILERNKNKEPLVSVSAEINKHLKPHQRRGIQFMYDCTIETIKSYKKKENGGGALLAHCMGLGKTLQVISYIHTVANNKNIQMKTFLVVAPLNTVLNWEAEFEKWLPVDQRMDVFVLSYFVDNKDRVNTLKEWHSNGGILITGYDMYRNLVNHSFIRSKKMKEEIKTCLQDPGPECVICDEGHMLRNSTSAISIAMNKIVTQRRIVLTGTPLQNNLSEYFVMVDFVKPKLLGTKKEFQNRFVNPIHNGQCSNSTPYDVKVMKQRCHVLYQLLSGCVQRQDYSVLKPFLPPKQEYTIFVRLTEKQRKMYQHYLEDFVLQTGEKLKGSSLFSDFQCLARIWSHPWALHLERLKQIERRKYQDDDSMDEFIDDESENTTSEEEDDKKPKWTADTSSDEEDVSKRRKDRRKAVSENDDDSSSSEDEVIKPTRTTRRTTRAAAKMSGNTTENENSKNAIKGTNELPQRGSLRSGINFKDDADNPQQEEMAPQYEPEWYDKFLTEEDEENIELSGKLVLLLEILANAEVVGDKVLVFSQSLTSLDIIERALGGGTIGGNTLNWCHGVDYFRMDGSTAVQKRQRWAEIFNDPENSLCRLFLISTKAGSLGINMVAANRVVMFDCSWNPSHDVQSVFRVYRFGQEKPVYVYRLVSQGTMEEKIYDRQITKLAVAGRVVDEQQIERHFTDEEIRELYTFAPEDIKNAETPPLPKDPLLAEVLQRQHPTNIVRYHEHDLLLENIESEELTEEERQQAWKNYEEEKKNAGRRFDFSTNINQVDNFNHLFNQQQQAITSRIIGIGEIGNPNQPTRMKIAIPKNLPREKLQEYIQEQTRLFFIQQKFRQQEQQRLLQQRQQHPRPHNPLRPPFDFRVGFKHADYNPMTRPSPTSQTSQMDDLSHLPSIYRNIQFLTRNSTPQQPNSQPHRAPHPGYNVRNNLNR